MRDGGDAATLPLALSAPDIDQFGNFSCYHRHRVFRRVQPASRSKHGADIAERCIRSAVHDGHETVTPQKSRKFCVRDAFFRYASQQCRSHQDEPDSRGCQALVDGSHHRHAKAQILFAEPNLYASSLKQIKQLLGGSFRLSKAWQRKQSHRSGFIAASFSTASRIGVRDTT